MIWVVGVKAGQGQQCSLNIRWRNAVPSQREVVRCDLVELKPEGCGYRSRIPQDVTKFRHQVVIVSIQGDFIAVVFLIYIGNRTSFVRESEGRRVGHARGR